jgi:50S ribosomal protein L16 3-hydroxylase
MTSLHPLFEPSSPLPLLGGISAQTFMRKYWQKKPLLIRNAIADFKPLVSPAGLRRLAGQDGVEARWISRAGTKKKPLWRVEHGPFGKNILPPAGQPDWTLLVQGVDLHLDAAHELLRQFRFVPDARLDDLMISYATDGGGVGPHFDSYDVFLLQAHGQRRWRIGAQTDLALQEGVPLKILAHFEPDQEFVLHPSDMLYLPPRYAHDGVAIGECMTYSIGFRAPSRAEVVRELLLRWADRIDELPLASDRYADPRQPAVACPAELPEKLTQWVHDSARRMLPGPDDWTVLWGEYLTEPKSSVWFDAAAQEDLCQPWEQGMGLKLDRKTRMLVSDTHLFVNGESWRASGRDASLMRQLAHERQLDARVLRKASTSAQELLAQWIEDGWVHPLPEQAQGFTKKT